MRAFSKRPDDPVSAGKHRCPVHSLVGQQLDLPRDYGEGIAEKLRALGHKVRASRTAGAPSLLHIDQKTGKKHAAGDPRGRRSAAAY